MGFEFTIGMPMHILMHILMHMTIHMPMHMLMSMSIGYAFLIQGKDYLPNTAKLRNYFQQIFS